MDDFHINEIVKIIINDLETKGYRDIYRTIKNMFKDYRIVRVTDDVSMYNIKNNTVDINVEVYTKVINKINKGNNRDIDIRVRNLMSDGLKIHPDTIESFARFRAEVITPYMKRFTKYRIKAYLKDRGICRRANDYEKVKHELDLNHSVYDVTCIIQDKIAEDPFFNKFSDDVIEAARKYYSDSSFNKKIEEVFVSECKQEIETLVDTSFRLNVGLDDLQKMISESYIKRIHDL